MIVAITGGTSGIGKATALAFARRGDSVVIAARSADAVAAAVNDVEALGVRTLGVVADVSRYDDVSRIVDVDLVGTMYGCRAIVPHFRSRGRGTIINVASALADRAVPLLSTYCAAKAGVKSFSEALRMEMHATHGGIHVVVVLP